MSEADGEHPKDACRELGSLILDHLAALRLPEAVLTDLRKALESPVGQPDTELLRLYTSRSRQQDSRQAKRAEDAQRAPPSPRRSRGKECCAALIVFLASLVFLPSVTYSQWYIDELFAAVRNADARGETSLAEVLSHDFWGNPLWEGGWTHKSYRPLVVLSYALQYRFNGGAFKPQPLRAFNVALHSVNSILAFMHAKQFAPLHWACLASCLFAVQPVHAENVIYLVGRADALATLCWLLALAVGLRKSRGWLSRVLQLFLCTLLAVTAGLCKESGFCVLAQLALHELLGPRPIAGSFPYLFVFGGVFLGRSWLTGGTTAGFSFVDTPVQYHSEPGPRLFTYLYFHAKYAQLMVFPWTLSWDYSYDALPLLRETWRDVRFLAVVTAYLAVVALASWGASKRSRGVISGLGNVIIPFIPASNLFFLVGVTVGERLLYPCNIGAAVALASAGGHLQGRGPRRRCYSPTFALGLILLAVFGYRCGVRVYQWSDRERLFGPDAAAYPSSTKARHQWGTVLHHMGRFDEALVHYQASLDLHKDNALTEYCIAQIYIETGRSREALERFESILKGHALGFGSFNIYALYIDYGFTLMMLRRYEEAVAQLVHGLNLNEDVPHGLNALGYSLAHLRRAGEARNAFQQGLKYDPDNPYILNNMGVALMLSGEVEAGAEYVVRALQAEPSVPAFVHNARVVKTLVDTGQWPSEQLVLELFFNRGN